MALAFRIFYNYFNENNIEEGGTKNGSNDCISCRAVSLLIIEVF